jgi:hypothetical protein
VTKPLWVIEVAFVVKLTMVGPELELPLLLPLLDELEPLLELEPEELDPLELEPLEVAPLELPELLFEPLPLLLPAPLLPLLLLALTVPLLEPPLGPDSHALAAAAAASAQFVHPPHGND